MKQLASTHTVGHVNLIKHLFPGKILRDRTGDRQILNMLEMAVD